MQTTPSKRTRGVGMQTPSPKRRRKTVDTPTRRTLNRMIPVDSPVVSVRNSHSCACTFVSAVLFFTVIMFPHRYVVLDV